MEQAFKQREIYDAGI